MAESFGLYSKGVDYYHQGSLYEAKDILERALSLDPRNDEAQSYLDLVNAELEMRAKGRLDFYQEEDGLEREIDVRADSEEKDVYIETNDYGWEEWEEGDYENFEEDFEYEYKSPVPSPEPFPMSEDKVKAVVDALNTDIAPGRVRGEYKMSMGVTGEGLIWKDANGDYNERNFRMIDHNFPKTNTFDTRVYDRVKVVFDTNEGGEGLNFHSDITVDPWSFVGKTEKFTVPSVSWGDTAEVELKYWSGTRSTINETFYSLRGGNSFGAPEIKVIDGKTVATRVTGTIWDAGNQDIFPIPVKEIDFTFQPVRELWFDYNKDDSNLRIFPYGLQDQVLTSDDPIGLSNHHIYWEPSPWLDDWVPGHVNVGAVPNDFWRGQWSDDMAFFTRDSDLTRLTALRGASLNTKILGDTDFSMTVATPKGLWQDYGDVTAIPGAMRTKSWLTDSLMLGFTDTFRLGYKDDSLDSYNYVSGMDVSYDFNPTTNVVAEIAVSKSEDDMTDDTYKTEKNGSAVHVALKNRTSVGDARVAFTHMDEAFDPGLSNYRETRKDAHWGRHIHFEKPLDGSTSLKYEDIEPFRIGDGVDSGRQAINFRLNTLDFLDNKMDNLIDYRHVKDSEHKYVEGVFREENTFRLSPDWTSKFLFIYHDLPNTKAGIDPISYDSDTGEFLENEDIEEGKDPSVSTYSLGAEYAPEDWISVFGIYENTNDYRFSTGSHPNGLLNSTYFTNTEIVEGNRYRNEITQLYNQGFFDLPPYERFNIYRAGVSLRPSKNLGVDFDYTKNDFKFAAGIDDNINHFGSTLRYKFNDRLTGFFKYTFSKAYNLYRLNNNGGLKYEDHHNVFMELNYNVTEYGLLTIQFGEGSVVSPIWGASATPFGSSYPTLDTQHILRVYYHGVF
ncbi:hypothetical protein ACFL60_05985 [Candidatus Omnitrophota bacterium]